MTPQTHLLNNNIPLTTHQHILFPTSEKNMSQNRTHFPYNLSHANHSLTIAHNPNSSYSQIFLSQNRTHFPQNLSHLEKAPWENSLFYTAIVGLFSKGLEIYRNLDYNSQRNFLLIYIVLITGDFIYVH